MTRREHHRPPKQAFGTQRMNNNGRILRPDVPAQIGLEFRHGPNAQAVVAAIPGRIVVIGGLSQLLQVSSTVAAGVAQNASLTPEQVADRAVKIAMALHDEIGRVTAEEVAKQAQKTDEP